MFWAIGTSNGSKLQYTPTLLELHGYPRAKS